VNTETNSSKNIKATIGRNRPDFEKTNRIPMSPPSPTEPLSPMIIVDGGELYHRYARSVPITAPIKGRISSNPGIYGIRR
jgi:hypothetical protein